MTTLHVPHTPGVITDDQALDALHLLGLDPTTTRAAHIQPGYVMAEVYLLDHHGRRLPLPSGKWRTHTIAIRRTP